MTPMPTPTPDDPSPTEERDEAEREAAGMEIDEWRQSEYCGHIGL